MQIRVFNRKGIPLVLAFSCLFFLSARSQQGPTLQEELAPAIDMVVAADGSGDFTKLQAAVNAAPNWPSSPTVIFIKKGEYREKVLIPASKSRLVLIGEDVDSTVIVYDDDAKKIVDGEELGTFRSQSVQIDASYFGAMNLTFENDARPNGEDGKGQNVAVACYGDRAVFLHCRFIAWQDTYYSGSDDRQYFKDCFIEGAVDYIFGHTTTIFDSCQIHTVRSGGYITAASTKEDYQFGYVFFNSRITAPPGITGVYLGRPWKTWARTVFFECIEYENVSPMGWHVWDGKEETCYYAEYQCTGPGSDTANRVDWSHQLTEEQAAAYTRENIFSAGSSTVFSSNWDPAVDGDTLWSIVQKHAPMFMDSVNLDARIASLLLDGEPLAGWDPDVYEYSIEVGSDTAAMPELYAEAACSLARVSIEYPESLPGFATVQVLANDRATHSTYRIYFSVDGSYTDARLDSIRIANRLIENFDPEVLEYDVVLPAGTSKYYGLTGYAHVKGAWVRNNKPAALPGDGTIEVTAVDGKTSRTYLLHISLSTGFEEDSDPGSGLEILGPSPEGRVCFRMPGGGRHVLVSIWDMTGKLVHREFLGDLAPGGEIHVLETALEGGIYVIRTESSQGSLAGKLLIGD
jgi:pectinesterase